MTNISPDLARAEQDIEDRMLGDTGPDPDARGVAQWLMARFVRIGELDAFENEFEARYGGAIQEDERRAAILHLAAQLGASRRQLARDAKALDLYFDREAVVERVRRRRGEEERGIAFGLRRLGQFGVDMLQENEAQAAIRLAWNYDRDPRIRESGFTCLRIALESAFEAGEGAKADEVALWEVQRTALQPAETVAAQCEALRILALAAPQSAEEIVERRLSDPLPGDDFFVRREIVRLVAGSAAFDRTSADRLRQAMSDPSAAVRQCLAAELWRRSGAAETHCDELAQDDDPKVRAMMMARLPLLAHSIGTGRTVRILRSRLEQEADPFALRAALNVAVEWSWTDADIARTLAAELQDELAAIHSDRADSKLRSWAAETIEQIWCAADPEARALAERVRAAVTPVKHGGKVFVPGLTEAVAQDEVTVGRVLGVLAQDGYSLELLSGGKLRHGELIGFRSWRLYHEWRNPSSDKRQGFSHWTGRIWRGRIVAPSAIMAELAPTKVPGEPLYQPSEGNWRPWLPLPDLILSTIDSGKVVKVHSAEGITEIRPPRTFLQRLSARLKLTRDFARYAALRNWNEGSGSTADAYSKELRKIGVNLVLKENPDREIDPQVAQFFSFGPAVLAAPLFWDQAATYFSSLYANTLLQLSLFVALASAWFFFRHVAKAREMRRARDSLAIVVGGWGTRGKSGTERLKAAVFSALGHPLISKTTGNEAMFLYSLPFGDIREMFLFRPYDKATIWEQMNLAVLASKLRARVFLWECMGLTPAYVKVLQRHWMRDDIATITNTYPDHEDVQGPAGRNIPEVMVNFIPESSRLITSEEQMRPILAEAARELGTAFAGVGWLEAGLIPDEVLARFPYEEHPYNIALVTAMAAELGIAPDVAVKEMADRVVQDIGALKVYPEAHVLSRRLEFVLGNSANERFGALGNWARVGFDKQDPVAAPDTWITTVINNRADRVPRSRVFASIIVKDISADRHVLIGSNLEGLRGFIEEAWGEFAQGITLWPNDRATAGPTEELKSWAKRFRIVHTAEQLRRVLEAMLRDQPEGEQWLSRTASADEEKVAQLLRASDLAEATAIADRFEAAHRHLQEYRALEARLGSGAARDEIDRQLREQAHRWFQSKIVVIQDYYATGEQIVRTLAEITPPGFRNRIMGMQNIKGTGLDFVYRWHAWEIVHRACAEALSDDPAKVQRGLETLSSFREFGILSAGPVRHVVKVLRSREITAGEISQALLDLIEAQLQEQLAQQEKSGGEQEASGRWNAMIAWIEAFLDSGDAVRRRKKADLIYRELAAERISSGRAVVELKKLTTRQKGGWLKNDLKSRQLHGFWSALPAGRPKGGESASK